jgi:hypothetical protein
MGLILATSHLIASLKNLSPCDWDMAGARNVMWMDAHRVLCSWDCAVFCVLGIALCWFAEGDVLC